MNAKKQTGYKYDLSWLTFAKAFWNERYLAGFTAIVVASAAILFVRRLPAVYRADALVLVDTQKIPERFVSTTVTAEMQDRLTTISQEILSSTRLIKILADFDLYREERKTRVQEEILEMMRKDLDVKVEKPGGGNRPGAFRISYQGSDPVTVAKVTNRIANLYIEENLRNREVQAEGTSEFIETQLQAAKKQLDDLEANVGRYKLQHNGELPQQEGSLSGTLNRLQVELSGLQDASNRAEQSKILLQNSLTASEATENALLRALRPKPEAAAVASSEEESLTVAVAPVRAPSAVEQLTAKLQTLRGRYSDEHPAVKDTIKELEHARLSEKREQVAAATEQNPTTPPAATTSKQPAPRLDTAESAIIAAQLQQARERSANLRSQITALNRETEIRQADRRRIINDLNTYQSRLERLPIREQEMAALTRDYENSKLNYHSLLEKKIAAEMASDLERRQKSEKFTILDPARVPEKPVKPNRPVLYAASVLGAFALGIVLAVGKGLMQDKLLGEWELPKDVVLLGRVPRIELTANVKEEASGGLLARVAKLGAVFLLGVALASAAVFNSTRLLQV